MNLRRTVLAAICLVALGIVIPQGELAAQVDPQQEQEQRLQQQLQLQRQRQEQLENARGQWHQQHYGQTLVWNVQIVNAATFERILHPGDWIARGVSGPEEARWNIRRQLGFPADSDQRTVGGVTQRIIWGEMTTLSETPVATVTPLPTLALSPSQAVSVEGEVAGPRRRVWPVVLGGVIALGLLFIVVS